MNDPITSSALLDAFVEKIPEYLDRLFSMARSFPLLRICVPLPYFARDLDHFRFQMREVWADSRSVVHRVM